ncbi:TonB-dependent receptor domain-containing protein [Aliikangiella maris]|uniref:TonB-dependent receptor n=1 Tax=Aliikangiella maris TaxID=3162458 RepID=A0ABV3MMN7_9GAMM
MSTLNKCNPLAKAVRSALFAGAATALTFAPNVFAAEDGEDTEEQKVTITGSRIKRADIETSSPVQVTSSEEIKLSGYTRIEDLMNSLPQVEAAETSFLSNGAAGVATLDLRGMGAERTLVLINGRRLQPGGVYSQNPDVNQIPAALVERVEVMTGGGSSTYGADAVAGVVNFVMKDNFEGLEITAGASGYQHDNDNDYIQGLLDDKGFEYPTGSSGIDGKTYNLDITVGGSFDGGKGHATAYATYRRVNELRQGARDYSSCALSGSGRACGGSFNAVVPNFDIYPIDPISGDTVYGYAQYSPDDPNYNDAEDADNTIYGVNGRPGYLDDDENFVEYPWANPESGANKWYTLTPDSGFTGVGNNLYNYAPVNHFMRPDDRYTLGAYVNYEINEQFRPYLEISYMHDYTKAQIAESGTFFAEEYTISCDPDTSPLNADQLAATCGNYGLNANSGSTDNIAVYIGKRNIEGGPRVGILDHSSYRIVFGTEGDINDRWAYDASLQYGTTSSSNAYINDFFGPRITQAISANGLTCDGNCVPYNVFTYNGVTPEAAAQLTGTAILNGVTSQTVFNAFVTGELDATLPSAETPIAAVFGVEHRIEEFERIADEVFAKGQLLGQGGETPSIMGEYDVSELFTELSVPLVQGVEGVESLTLDLGYRYSDYSSSGSESTYKVALDYMPVDGWKVRASFNRAVRAPNVAELFQPQGLGLWQGADPCAGAIDPDTGLVGSGYTAEQCARTGLSTSSYGAISASQYNGLQGGNPDLKPEIADTMTFGVVGSPFEDFNFSIDYFNIELEDVIGALGGQLIIEKCAETGLALFCDKINRSGSGSLWLGQTGFVERTNINLASRHWTGVDLSANFQMELGDGILKANMIGTYMTKKEYIPLPELPEESYDCAGTVSTDCFAQPDWRHSLKVSYSTDSFWTVSAKWRYYGKVDYTGTADELVGEGISSQSYFDIKGSFDVADGVGVLVGINNVFDKEPPLVGGTLSNNANAIAGFYDVLGRYIHASVTFNF